MNIPIYRANILGSNKNIVGWFILEYYDCVNLIRYSNVIFIDSIEFFEIDPITLAIHFPDMIDSQGNKIFCSLSEDGKGGDTMKDDEYYGIAKYKDSRFVVEYENVEECLYEGNFEVIGIQE